LFDGDLFDVALARIGHPRAFAINTVFLVHRLSGIFMRNADSTCPIKKAVPLA
tara:strand:- start:1566 stop:1724 length:159 start_codon:yes stop_codon:yes gene_type:complete